MTFDDKIRDVLGRLAMLAEGATANLDPDQTSHGAPESKVPAGATIATDSRRPPDKDRCSLHEWFSWHFAHCDDPDRRLSLYLLAEIEYNAYRFRVSRRVELRSGELTENDAQDGGAAERQAAERIVSWYEGKPALLVAMLENQTEAWVKKARRLNGRNPVDGRPRPEFLDWDEDRRRREVAALAQRMGQKKAADRLGVAKSTVQPYWPELVAA